jgi:hypothetical protein
MYKDIVNDLGVSVGISPVAARTDNTEIVSVVLDLQGKTAAAFLTNIGTNTDADATFTALLEESDTGAFGGEENAVADNDLILTEASASFDFSDDVQVRKLGYRGSKRYIRYSITPANNAAGNIFISGLWVWTSDISPVAQTS